MSREKINRKLNFSSRTYKNSYSEGFERPIPYFCTELNSQTVYSNI